MNHAFLDRYATLESPLHRLPASIKMLFTLSALGLLLLVVPFVSHTWGWVLIITYAGLMSLLAIISRVPLTFLLTRSTLVLPFSVLIVVVNYFSGNFSFNQMLITVSKSLLSIFAILLLISTTPFNSILKQLSRWGASRLMIIIFSFMYRYFFLLVGEIESLEKAVAMRHSSLSGWKRFKTYANMVGMLMIRSFDRAERVYQAMQMRGFTGDLS
ncbi:MAG: energy-coupling factor transporter transmembrane protein EcfT [Candidatus Marinimicrobia bacterium]|nr:energy-coupling factor transporter transmembrane protein EcfT [Candidatus Neomarinimicrobiota bacterium]MCF7851358.1 energy-coupling factor transporter transmembrane protein EcfT [Candidatus Neomarinimicrobiota bacterium]MCF7905164.1 energy-coupling factor transporter transmembrane protein EcfT [Candidatus Neomarinimicrobiota bacterium]